MNNQQPALVLAWQCLLLLLACSSCLSALPDPPTHLLDQQMAASADAVIRAEVIENKGGSKYVRTHVRLLQTLKAPEEIKFPATLDLAHLSFAKGLPKGQATLYLKWYNKDQPENGWKLLEVYDAKKKSYSKGYSHHDSVAEQEVWINVDGGKLAGTLTRAIGKNANSNHAVVFISGSGPTDRDSNTVGALGKNNCLRLLSDEIVKFGFTTLRIDKRGVGGSIGVMMREEELRFSHFVDDITRCIEFLNSKGYSKITLLGHSEGALVATMAARHQSVVSVISVAGVGNPFQDTLRKQLKPAFDDALYQKADKIIASLIKQERVEEVPPALNTLFRPSVQPYLMSLYKIKPSEEIAKLAIPVLIIQGTTDLQVFEEDAKALNQSAKDSKLVLIKGMNHVLKKAKGGMKKQWASYHIPTIPLHPELGNAIREFLK